MYRLLQNVLAITTDFDVIRIIRLKILHSVVILEVCNLTKIIIKDFSFSDQTMFCCEIDIEVTIFEYGDGTRAPTYHTPQLRIQTQTSAFIHFVILHK